MGTQIVSLGCMVVQEWPDVGYLSKGFTYFLEIGREGERERNISAWLLLMCHTVGTWPAT